MANDQTPETTWLSRIVALIHKSPLIAICIYLAYQVYRMQIYVENKETRWEQMLLEKDKEIKSAWTTRFEEKKKELQEKEQELSKKYENDPDTAKKSN